MTQVDLPVSDSPCNPHPPVSSEATHPFEPVTARLPVLEGSLVEFLAVRLILDRYAVTEIARDAADYRGPLSELREHVAATLAETEWPPGVEPRAFVVFHLAQLFGLPPDALSRMSPGDWAKVVGAIEAFTGLERRRTFHLAYERRFVAQTLDAIALRAPKRVGRPPSPRFRMICCLDEREESFRRHVEELAPATETFGAAGFFSIPLYYRGAADAHFVPLCPVVVIPRHWVVEEVDVGRGRSNRRRARTRKVLGAASHRLHIGSGTPGFGAILTGLLGIFAPFPLVGRILFARLTARIKAAMGRMLRTPTATHLHLECFADASIGNGSTLNLEVKSHPASTSRSAPRTWRKPGPNSGTPPTPSRSSVAASGPAACFSTGGHSLPRTTRRGTTPTARP